MSLRLWHPFCTSVPSGDLTSINNTFVFLCLSFHCALSLRWFDISMDLCCRKFWVFSSSIRHFTGPHRYYFHNHFFMALHSKIHFSFVPTMKRTREREKEKSGGRWARANAVTHLRSERVNKSIKPTVEIVYNSKSINIIEFE